MALYGGLIIMCGHLFLSMPFTATAWVGICLVAAGTGFIKPNLSTIVGGLYDADDPRRDAGFQLFYMAVNLGSLISPIVTGLLKDHFGYHVGFIAAAIGMAIALVAFLIGRHKLSKFAFDVPNPLKPGEGKRLLLVTLAVIAGCALLFWIFLLIFKTPVSAIAYMLFAVSAIGSIAFFTMMFKSKLVTSVERSHMRAYIPLWIGAMLFFMIFEQASGKMAVFAKDNTDGKTGLFGWVMTPEAYQAVNPAAVVLLTPLFAWLFLKRAGKFPSVAQKFAMAVAIIGISALMMGLGFQLWPAGQLHLSPWWYLAVVFIVQTLGELALSPVGLAATTALAPRAFASQGMTLWLLASATGQGVAAVVIERTSNISDATYYYGLGIVTLVVAAVLFFVAPWTQRQMADIGSGASK